MDNSEEVRSEGQKFADGQKKGGRCPYLGEKRRGLKRKKRDPLDTSEAVRKKSVQRGTPQVVERTRGRQKLGRISLGNKKKRTTNLLKKENSYGGGEFPF